MTVTMKILKDHDEWLSNRNRIGGSDASAIVGMNPFSDNVKLWEIKTGRAEQKDISEEPYVKYGTEAEPLIRQLFELDHPQYKVFYEENNMFFNDKYPFAHASLDGWLEDEKGRKGILEIKTTNISRKTQRLKWDNRIPDNYYIQVLHYLMVTEFEFVELVAQLKSEYGDNIYKQTRHYHIERADVAEDIAYLIKKEKEFWKYIEDDKRPSLILPAI